jgi:hypothetical protein
MVGAVVDTYFDGEMWRNRVGAGDPLPGEHRTREAAAEIGRNEARLRGVQHVVRRRDGSIEDRRRYPRRSDELPL